MLGLRGCISTKFIMTQSYSEWESHFHSFSLKQLVADVGKGVSEKTFNELAAVYSRFLNIGLHDPNTSDNDRAMAACWARSLEFLIKIGIEHDLTILAKFMEARNARLQYASEWGYGSVGYIAVNEPNNVCVKTFAADGENAERDDERDRRHFLMSAAFGRESDNR